MRFPKSLLIGAVLFGAFPVGACGPYFPEELLSNRHDTLLDLIEGTFDYEAAHLLPKPHDGLVAVEPDPTQWDVEAEYERLRTTAEIAGLSESEAALVRSMRAKTNEPDNDTDAYVAGNGLPEAVRLYTAGAVKFKKGYLNEAEQRFRAVLALPEAERKSREVWATYMLARIQVQNGDYASATQGFQQTRRLVSQGIPDPLGLAVASYGEEAQLFLPEMSVGNKALPDEVALPSAIKLYAEQAAHGSASGRHSLLFVARGVFQQPNTLAQLLADPLTQRVLVGYAYSRSNELSETSESVAVDAVATETDSNPSPEANTATNSASTAILRLIEAIEQRGLEHVEGADRLAAVAYRAGKFDLAARLADKDNSALAAWVKAKLALRKGDTVSAAVAYAEAAKAFPAEDDWSAVVPSSEDAWRVLDPLKRVAGERGVLALARGEYLSAFDNLYKSGYVIDASYIAERVLSIDELKQVIDAKIPEKTPGVTESKAANSAGSMPLTSDEESNQLSPLMRMRWLLARRLMRAGRYEEAFAYFDEAELKAKAQQYAKAIQATVHGDRIERARAWFDAAQLARFKGMELLGFELAPDYAIWGGGFEGDATYGGPRQLGKEFTSDDEHTRFAASSAVHPVRFHYRVTAVDHVLQAADLLPQRSQAFAVVLCHATSWVINRQPELAQTLYRRYVKQGSAGEWWSTFGHNCEEPDFEAAAQRLGAERVAKIRHYAKRWGPYGLLAFSVLLTSIWLWCRRKSRKAAASQ